MKSQRIDINKLDDEVDINILSNLYEETMEDIKKGSWELVKKRVKSQGLVSTYLGVTKEGIIKYKTTSGTTKGKYWYQEVYLEDLPDVVQVLNEDSKFTARDALILAMRGNVKVYCNDLSFKYYGWQYMAWKKGYGLRPETRYPKKRNPSLTGIGCKHLCSVMRVLPMDWSKIVRDMRRQGIIPRKGKGKGNERNQAGSK